MAGGVSYSMAHSGEYPDVSKTLCATCKHHTGIGTCELWMFRPSKNVQECESHKERKEGAVSNG